MLPTMHFLKMAWMSGRATFFARPMPVAELERWLTEHPGL
jgi:hypothetical protein